MLNLTVMNFLWLGFRIFFGMALVMMFQQPSRDEPIVITIPAAGDVLQGVTAIQGIILKEEIRSFEISFAYQRDQTGVWFLISRGNQPDSNGNLAFWDTNSIADGLYRIKITGTRVDGKTVEVIIPNLRVRNYSPIESATPTNIRANVEITPTFTVSPMAKTALPSPTNLPPNPAELSSMDLVASTVWVLGGIIVTMGIIIGYLALKKA
jgi:hypothetical protein